MSNNAYESAKLIFDPKKGRWASSDPEIDQLAKSICERPDILASMVAAGPAAALFEIRKHLKK
jgi:hypothetical protein